MTTSFDTHTDWYALWMKQSKIFFDTANENLQDIFTTEKLIRPEEHLAQIQNWMENLNRQWGVHQPADDQEAYQAYWRMMARMCNDASALLLDQWMQRSREDNPIKTIRELYELWLSCCHDVYQRSVRSKNYQDMYGDLMNASIKFWQSVTPK